MSIEAYMWTSFCIPETDGRPFVTTSTIDRIQKILLEEGLGPKWHRLEEWLYWNFEYATNEGRRLVLHGNVHRLLVADLADRNAKKECRDPLVFWRGAVTRIYEARAMNLEITSP